MFQSRPKDEETTVLMETETEFDQINVMVEAWIWNGIQAESLIFLEEQLGEMTDDELISLASKHYNIEGSTTITRNSDGFAYLNHKFTEKE